MDSKGGKGLGEAQLCSSGGGIPFLTEKPVTGVYAFPHLRKMGLAALISLTVTLGNSILCFPMIHAGNTKEEQGMS